MAPAPRGIAEQRMSTRLLNTSCTRTPCPILCRASGSWPRSQESDLRVAYCSRLGLDEELRPELRQSRSTGRFRCSMVTRLSSWNAKPGRRRSMAFGPYGTQPSAEEIRRFPAPLRLATRLTYSRRRRRRMPIAGCSVSQWFIRSTESSPSVRSRPSSAEAPKALAKAEPFCVRGSPASMASWPSAQRNRALLRSLYGVKPRGPHL